MNMERYVFEREDMHVGVFVPRFDFHNIIEDPFVKGRIEHRFTKSILAMQKQERIIDYTFPKPTFLEWLLRKERTVKIKVKSKDVKLNPPALPDDTIRFYEFDVIKGYYYEKINSVRN